MPQKQSNEDRVLAKLTEIHTVLQDLLTIEGARAGISKSEVRNIVGVADARVTRVWKHLKIKLPEQ